MDKKKFFRESKILVTIYKQALILICWFLTWFLLAVPLFGLKPGLDVKFGKNTNSKLHNG